MKLLQTSNYFGSWSDNTVKSNQIAKYFNTGGTHSQAMENEIHQCISDLFLLRKKVLEMAGDFHGDTKAHQK